MNLKAYIKYLANSLYLTKSPPLPACPPISHSPLHVSPHLKVLNSLLNWMILLVLSSVPLAPP